jgi:hypothetical protein
VKIFYGAGLNENQYPHPSEAAAGSYNFDLKKDSSYLHPRMPFDLLATATGGAEIKGMLQLIKRDDTETTLIQSGASLLKWDGATTFSSVATVTSVAKLRDTYWSLGDYLVVTDLSKRQVVSKWDGSTFSTLTTGLGSNLYAKYGIVHHGRVWLFNVTTTTDTPHLMVASAFENPESYDTSKRAVSGTFVTGSEAFYMLTPDLKPINGVALSISGDLVVSTERGRLFKLTGSSATDYRWVDFYPQSGAIGDEAIVSVGNDIHYMRQGAAIESLQATQNYGDVAADDLSRWIPDTIKNQTGAIAVYDQQNQKVLWFLSGASKALVFFKDVFHGGAVIDETGAKAKLSPWSVYKTSHGSDFTTSCARYMRIPGTDNYSVLFGDSAGRIFNLNGTGNGDAGDTDITVVRKTRFLGAESGLDFTRKIPKGKVQYQRTQQCSISIALEWGDEYNTSTASVTLDGPLSSDSASYFGGSSYFGGTVYFNSGTSISGVKSHLKTSWVGRGTVVTKTVSSTNRVRYHIDHIELK